MDCPNVPFAEALNRSTAASSFWATVTQSPFALSARLEPVQAEASTEAGAALFAAADFVAVGEADAFVAFAVGEVLAEDGEGFGVAVVALGVGDAVGDGIGSGNSSASTCGAASGDETTAGALGATAASGGWVAHAGGRCTVRCTRWRAWRSCIFIGCGLARTTLPRSGCMAPCWPRCWAGGSGTTYASAKNPHAQGLLQWIDAIENIASNA